jgi:serine phosphatase RsbU (regulator of sigma subunit)
MSRGSLLGVGFEIALRFSSCADMDGDFAGHFQLPDGLVDLPVEDVVGKGLTATMHAALVMDLLRAANKTAADRAWLPWLC